MMDVQNITQHGNWVDYGIMALIGLSVLISFWRGFIREAMSLIIWVSAFCLAVYFFIPVSEFLFSSISIIVLRVTLSFVLILLSVLILGGLLSYFIGRLIKFTGFGTTDRMVGVLFGLARGAIVIALAIMLFTPTPLAKDKQWQQSKLLPHFQPLAEPLALWMGDFSTWVKDHIPEDLIKKLQSSV